MAVIDHDHPYLNSQSWSSAAPEKAPAGGLISVFSFLGFWLAFMIAVWVLHALVDKMF